MESLEPRETTFEERATWGECPICHAKHGEWCFAEVGFQLGMKISGGRMETGEGVHLARLSKAPMKVKLIGV